MVVHCEERLFAELVRALLLTVTCVGAWDMVLQRLRICWELVKKRASHEDSVAVALRARMREMERATEPVPFNLWGMSDAHKSDLSVSLGLNDEQRTELMASDGEQRPPRGAVALALVAAPMNIRVHLSLSLSPLV